jgi:hypothetical protein
VRQTIIFIFLVSFQLVNGQQSPVDPTTFNYSKADSIALNIPKRKYKSYTELAALLTDGLHTEHEKARVLFRWITDNISYSYSNRSSDANNVLKKKKAVCIGYSNLFKEMCECSGIECVIVEGYAKTSVEDINKKCKDTDHAWNAVKLNERWYLIDVTWASGHHDTKSRKSIKSYNELYYLTPPDNFIKKHLPVDENWQLVERPVKKADFEKQPVYYSGCFENHVFDLQPEKGLIKVSLRDSLIIQFQSDLQIRGATISLGENQHFNSPDISRNGNFYLIKHKFERKGSYELTLFLNEKSVATYNLRVR